MRSDNYDPESMTAGITPGRLLRFHSASKNLGIRTARLIDTWTLPALPEMEHTQETRFQVLLQITYMRTTTDKEEMTIKHVGARIDTVAALALEEAKMIIVGLGRGPALDDFSADMRRAIWTDVGELCQCGQTDVGSGMCRHSAVELCTEPCAKPMDPTDWYPVRIDPNGLLDQSNALALCRKCFDANRGPAPVSKPRIIL